MIISGVSSGVAAGLENKTGTDNLCKAGKCGSFVQLIINVEKPTFSIFSILKCFKPIFQPC